MDESYVQIMYNTECSNELISLKKFLYTPLMIKEKQIIPRGKSHSVQQCNPRNEESLALISLFV